MASDRDHLPNLPDTLTLGHLGMIFRWESPDWPEVIGVELRRASIGLPNSAQIVFNRGYNRPTKAAAVFHRRMEQAVAALQLERPEEYAEFRRFHGNAVVYRPMSLDWTKEERAKFTAVAEACVHVVLPGCVIQQEWEHGSNDGGWTCLLTPESFPLPPKEA